MASSNTVFILLSVISFPFPFIFCRPVLIPLMFWLYADLLKYSGETVTMLSSGQLVSTVPDWVNKCLDASTQITEPGSMDIGYDLGNELTQARIIYGLTLCYYIVGSIVLAAAILLCGIKFCCEDCLESSSSPRISE